MRRNELSSRLYLEYLKYWKQFMDKTIELENDFLSKNGLKVQLPEWYGNMLEKYYDIVRASYSSQAQITETALNMMNESSKLLNGNIGGLTDLMSSASLWWIPPTKDYSFVPHLEQ